MKQIQGKENADERSVVVIPTPVVAKALRHPLLERLMVTEAGHRLKATDYTYTCKRGCPGAKLVYCLEGNGWCNAQGQLIKLSQGQLLAIRAGVPHIYGSESGTPWSICWLQIAGTDVPFYLEKIGIPVDKSMISFGIDCDLESKFRGVSDGLKRGFSELHLIYAAHALAHLIGLILLHKEQLSMAQKVSHTRVHATIEYMKSNLHETVTIRNLASRAHLSKPYYTNIFQRITGCSPMEYLTRLRMERAKQLLHCTDWPVSLISDQLGYTDQFYFSRRFKKTHYLSPSEYRMSVLGQRRREYPILA